MRNPSRDWGLVCATNNPQGFLGIYLELVGWGGKECSVLKGLMTNVVEGTIYWLCI